MRKKDASGAYDSGHNHYACYRAKEDDVILCVPPSGIWCAHRWNRIVGEFRRSLAKHGIEELGRPTMVPVVGDYATDEYVALHLDAGRDRYALCRQLWEEAVYEVLR